MWSKVGIFPSPAIARQAVEGLLEIGVPRHSIVFLSRDTSQGALPENELDNLPTTDAERDGMGKAMGALLGGGVGASAGLGGGAAVASMFVPGVGMIFAIGLGAAALLGLGGAVAGAELGNETEHALDTGVPKDDIVLYHQLLHRGDSLVIATMDDEKLAEQAQKVFQREGSEDFGIARRGLEAA
ncbi:MAG TPA: hypothetical protein VND65_13210 [Candidatus Binatia bacterium]|nr:hypothetical protein [Candidatus Binatia bacterium]